MKITYITGNWAKVKSTKQILEPLGIEVDNVKMGTTEIQADTVEEVAIHSAKEASEKLNCSTLKNDTGLFIEELRGISRTIYTLCRWENSEKTGVLKLLEGKENRKAMFIEAYAYCEYGKEPKVFKSITKGTIAKEKSGKYGWSWDYIFIPDGYEIPMGNYPDEERFAMWNNDGLKELAKYLKEKNEN